MGIKIVGKMNTCPNCNEKGLCKDSGKPCDYCASKKKDAIEKIYKEMSNYEY